IPCTTISDDTFRREREVVSEEVEQKHESFAGVAAIDAALYPDGHPYHRASSTPASIRAITRDQACAFAARHYGLDHAVLVVSGHVTKDELEPILRDVLPGIPARTVDPQPAVPPVLPHGQRTTLALPGNDRAVLVAWPLPADPHERTIVLAVARMMADRIAPDINGVVVPGVAGGARAPQLVIAVLLRPGETANHVLDLLVQPFPGSAKVAATEFEHERQRAIHALFTSFEDGLSRDALLAGYVEAGGEAGASLADQIATLNHVSFVEAVRVGQDTLALQHARIVDIVPAGSAQHTAITALAAPIHEAGQPRGEIDPAEAHQAAGGAELPDPFAGAITRRLPNGLTVELLPLSSVPAVDIRLVFAAGSADDPPDKPGLADLAAHATNGLRSLEDMSWWMPFFKAGGNMVTSVTADHTTYEVTGIDMYLDHLLTGLARDLRSATPEQVDQALVALRRATKRTDAPKLPTTWPSALYGADHPYAHALFRATDAFVLDGASVIKFREQHFAPSNATLIVAGGFDVAVANAWIDYLFGTWDGVAPPRPAPPAHATPIALAVARDEPQVALEISLPATLDERARPGQLVAAAMMKELLDDVRHRLAASYGVSAELDAQRLAVRYAIEASIDSARAVEATALVRDQLAKLRAGGPELAATFVRARARVLLQLRATTAASRALAEAAERAVDLGHDLHADVATARAVRALTLDALAPTLAALDLGRGAILVRGPREVATAMFAALGRTPTFAP
ncbi:MAG TPA: insulinase family protein, partial [Kofleriaceae bacterium]|nr:insulinase family protein [Kofleriaceae bacterium]